MEICNADPNMESDPLSDTLRSRLLGLVKEAADCGFI